MICNKLKTIIQKLKANKLIKDSLWSLLGNVIGKGLALVAGIVVARLLGKDLFGEYGVVRSTILTIGIFSTFGLGYTATKYIAQYKNHSREKLELFIKYANIITLTFSGTMAILLFVFAEIVAIKVFDIAHLKVPLRILSILIIFNAITTTQIGVLAGFGKFKEIAKINSLIGVLTFVFSSTLTYFFSLEGALLSLLIVQILNCIFNFFVVRKELPKDVDFIKKDTSLFREILSFSTPIALQECTYAVVSWLSSILLVRYASVGDLGMHSAAMQWNAVILFIPGILRNVVLSHLSSSADNKSQHNYILKKTIQVNFVATLIPCILVALASGYIAKSYGETFAGLQTLISVAVFGTVFISISNVYAQAYTSISKNWLMLAFRLFRDVGYLILSFILLTSNVFEGAMNLIVSKILIYTSFLVIMAIGYQRLNKNFQEK